MNYHSEKYCIYYTIDQNYWKHLTVSLHSLCENYNGDIYVFYDYLDGKIKKKIKKIFFKRVKFIKLKFYDYKLIINKTNYKYFYKILPIKYLSKYNKILYLDADTIVRKNIDNIFLTKFGNFDIAGVKEPFKTSNEYYHMGGPRINTGVMLIKTDKWINKNYTEKILRKFTSLYNSRLIADQPIINITVKKIKILNPIYNWVDGYNDRYKNKNCYNDNINILHFNKDKPWLLNSNSHYKSLYRLYRRKFDRYFFAQDLFNIKSVYHFFLRKLKFFFRN
jgi:lipopolysaccharide biosynthesis glycosyltransferase